MNGKRWKIKHHYKVFLTIAAIVAICTTYVLKQPGIAMVNVDTGYENLDASYTSTSAEVTADISADDSATVLTDCSDSQTDRETEEDMSESVASAELTGNNRADVSAVAETQIGYTESATNYVILSDGVTQKGYTRYGAFMGNDYEDWSAAFAAFVLNYAGVNSVPVSIDATEWVNTLNSEDTALFNVNSEGYIPKAGDVVFLKYAEGSDRVDNVGVVAAEQAAAEQAAAEQAAAETLATAETLETTETTVETDDTVTEETAVTLTANRVAIITSVNTDEEGNIISLTVITGNWDNAVVKTDIDLLTEDAPEIVGSMIYPDEKENTQEINALLADDDGSVEAENGEENNTDAEDADNTADSDSALLGNKNLYSVRMLGTNASNATSISPSNLGNISSGGSFALSESGSYTGGVIEINSDVTLDLNGCSLSYTAENLFKINSGGTLTIIDSKQTEGTNTYNVYESTVNNDGLTTTEKNVSRTYNGYIQGSSSGSIINLQGGTFNLESGVLVGGTGGDSGKNGMSIWGNSGTINMSGGAMINGSTSGNGGAVVINSSCTMNMTGGDIAGNTASNGGGIYVDGGTLNISGGYITNNTASYALNDTGRGNYDSGGGGVHAKNGTVNMSGGYVTGNQAKGGGGLFIGEWEKSVTFTFTAGTIAGNKAINGEGGGIRVGGGSSAKIFAEGGEKLYITNNNAYGKYDWGGGGIFVQENGTLYINNALITQNTAEELGGGVAFCATGTTTNEDGINGAAIYGNNGNFKVNRVISETEGLEVKNYDHAFIDQYINGHSSTDGRDKSRSTVGVADDYFYGNGHDALGSSYALEELMPGNGTENWTYATNDISWSGFRISQFGINYDNTTKYVVAATSGATDDSRSNAAAVATAIISGNWSYTNGGGITGNGKVSFGMTSYGKLVIEGKKSLQSADGDEKSLTAGQFDFILYKNIDTSDLNNITFSNEFETISNDASGIILFNELSFIKDGEYTYYLTENEPSGDTSGMEYDKTIYKIVATVTSTTDSSGNVTYSVGSVKVTKLNAETGAWESETSYTPDSNNKVSLYSSTAATFTNKEPKPYILPNTGGLGTGAFHVMGITIMIAAGILLLIKKYTVKYDG